MKLNRILVTLIAVSLSSSVCAESKVFEFIKNGLYGEFGSQIASLPGLKEIQKLEKSKEFKLVTNEKNKGQLKYEPSKKHGSAWVSLHGKFKAVLLLGDATLPAGQHTLFVFPKNERLLHRELVVNIPNHGSQTLYVDKFYSEKSYFKLNIITIPRNARIRVMNIKPKYRYGMLLPHKEGGYDVEISKRGYKTIRKFVDLNSDDQLFSYMLERR